MYYIELPFILLGFIALFRRNLRLFIFLLGWGILAAVPAALTINPYSSTRTLLMLPVLCIVTANGIISTFRYLKRYSTNFARYFIFILSLVYIGSFSFFLNEYFIHFPINRAAHWGVAQEKVASYLLEKKDTVREILITNPSESLYVYLAYLDQYDPTLFQKTAEYYPELPDGFSHMKSFDRYQFGQVDYPDDLKVPYRIIVDKTTDVPLVANDNIYFLEKVEGNYSTVKSRIAKTIKLPDGTPVYSIIETYLD